MGWVKRGTCILDVNLVSAFVRREAGGARLPELMRFADEVSFCLSDGGVSELTIGLANNQLSIDDWFAALPVLTHVIDDSSPILFHDSGPFVVKTPPGGIAAQAYYWGVWRLMTKHLIKDGIVARLRDGVVIAVDGIKHVIWSDPEFHRQRVVEGRAAWSKYIKNVGGSEATRGMSEAEIVARLEHAMAERHGSAVVADYDGFHRAAARFLKLYARGYNPDSEKRAGDFPDISMLTHLSRATLCTLDERLIKHVDASGTAQSSFVCSLDDLLATLSSSRWRLAS
jgi:hypothetical protein